MAADEGTPQAAHRNIRALAELAEASLAQRSQTARLSDAVTWFAGTPACLIGHVAWLGGWLVWNAGWLGVSPFDPFPFSLLALILALEAILLSLFILMSQARMQRLADERAHLDLHVNLLAESEATKMLGMLRSLCAHFNLPEAIDGEAEDLEAATDPQALLVAIRENLPE
jgi:uncharacterized membrane protein